MLAIASFWKSSFFLASSRVACLQFFRTPPENCSLNFLFLICQVDFTNHYSRIAYIGGQSAASCPLPTWSQGVREGGWGGTSYPGPGLGGPSSFGPTQPNLSEDLFFWSSPNFGQKSGPNLSEDLSWFNFTKF